MVARLALEEVGAIPLEYGFESRKKISDMMIAFSKQKQRGAEAEETAQKNSRRRQRDEVNEGGDMEVVEVQDKGRRSRGGAAGVKRKAHESDGKEDIGDVTAGPEGEAAKKARKGASTNKAYVGEFDDLADGQDEIKGKQDDAGTGGPSSEAPGVGSVATATTAGGSGTRGEPPPAASRGGRGLLVAPPRGSDDWRRVMFCYPEVPWV